MELFKFKAAEDFTLSARLWRESESSRGTIVASHGYSEHSGCYEHVAKFFNDHGFSFAMLDLPGHGLSEGRRSDIQNFDHYVRSFEYFYQELEKIIVPRPYYIFGHSLGGLIVTRFLQSSSYATSFRAAFLSSPLFGLSTDSFHRIGVFLQNDFGLRVLEVICGVLPNITLPNKSDLGSHVLTHDIEMAQKRDSDMLISPQVTISWTHEFLKARRKAFAESSKLLCPVGIFQAGDDRVVSAGQAERFYNQLSKEKSFFKLYPKLFHEILNEVEREHVLRDMLDFVASNEGFESKKKLGQADLT